MIPKKKTIAKECAEDEKMSILRQRMRSLLCHADTHDAAVIAYMFDFSFCNLPCPGRTAGR
jgi:hypothetical protein